MKNKLKEALLKTKLSFGGWLQIGHPACAEIFARAGFDWICVDLEHGAIDIETMTNIFRVLSAFDCVPVARLPINDPVWVHLTLDAGAKTTLRFSFAKLDRLILGYHTLMVKASSVLGELDRDDNIIRTSFKGRIVRLPVILGKSVMSMVIDVTAALSVFVVCGVSALFFFRILMSERPLGVGSILKRLRESFRSLDG